MKTTVERVVTGCAQCAKSKVTAAEAKMGTLGTFQPTSCRQELAMDILNVNDAYSESTMPW